MTELSRSQEYTQEKRCCVHTKPRTGAFGVVMTTCSLVDDGHPGCRSFACRNRPHATADYDIDGL